MNATNEAERIWSGACALIEERLSEKDFQTWILELGARSFDGETLTLEAPFGLFRDRVKQSFLPTIEASVSAAAKRACQVVVVVGQFATSLAAQRARGGRTGAFATRTPQAAPVAKPKPTREKTFDGFLVGEGNRLAYLGARQLAEGGAGEGGNPLFLYGGVGLGKTHLMHAIGHYVLQHDAGLRLTYISSERFMNEMINALRFDRILDFRARYNLEVIGKVDVSLVGGQQYSLISRSATDLAGCKGKPLASDHATDPRFLEKVVARGAFVLADAGLLDGRRATTHWGHAKALQAAHPEVQVEADRINREMMDEAMDVVLTAFENELFSYHGKYYNFPPAGIPDRGGFVETLTLVPRPLYEYEVWQAITSPPSLQHVPERGFGGVFWLMNHQFIKQRWHRFGEIWEQHHGPLAPGEKRNLVLNICIEDTHEQAWRSARMGHDEYWKFLGPYGWSKGYMGKDGKPAPSGLIPTLEESVDQKVWVIGTPEEVAAAVGLLASDEGGFINGQMIQVNGGAET